MIDPASAAADLSGYAERPRAHGWTLRSALVRFAQGEPIRASMVLELIRRTDGALDRAGAEAPDALVDVARDLGQIGDLLDTWADAPTAPRPNAAIDDLAERAYRGLAALDVPRETRPPRRSGGAGSRGSGS